MAKRKEFQLFETHPCFCISYRGGETIPQGSEAEEFEIEAWDNEWMCSFREPEKGCVPVPHSASARHCRPASLIWYWLTSLTSPEPSLSMPRQASEALGAGRGYWTRVRHQWPYPTPHDSMTPLPVSFMRLCTLLLIYPLPYRWGRPTASLIHRPWLHLWL